MDNLVNKYLATFDNPDWFLFECLVAAGMERQADTHNVRVDIDPTQDDVFTVTNFNTSNTRK